MKKHFCLILIFVLGEKSGKRFIKDDGLVQITGLCLVSLASLLCIYYALLSRGQALSYLMGGYVLLIYAMREADLHKVLSPESFATKIQFYLHPDIGIGPKIIGASFGPVCGAMAADYLLASKQWAGPRAGFNMAGWISWLVGFAVGAADFIPGMAGIVPCPPVAAFLVGFILYLLLAKAGWQSKPLEMPVPENP